MSKKRSPALGVGSAALEQALARDRMVPATVIQGEESGAVHVTANLRREGFSQVFSFTALASGKCVYMERVNADVRPLHGSMVYLLEQPAERFVARPATARRRPALCYNRESRIADAG